MLLLVRGGAHAQRGGGAASEGAAAFADAAGEARLPLADCALLLSACGAFSLLQYELLHAYSHRALPPWLQVRRAPLAGLHARKKKQYVY